MEPSQMSNFEAACNICANLSEIVGIKSGAAILVAGFILVWSTKKSIAVKLIICGFVVLAVGLAIPGIVNATYGNFGPGGLPEVVGLIIYGLMTAVGTVIGIATLFVPAIVCNRRGVKFTNMMAILSWIGLFIPVTLSVAMAMAFKAETGNTNFDDFKSDVTRKGEEI